MVWMAMQRWADAPKQAPIKALREWGQTLIID